jgi:hypothetical protein
MTVKNKEQAIAELWKVNPDYANALSGKNPPETNKGYAPAYPLILVILMGLVLPTLCLSYSIGAIKAFIVGQFPTSLNNGLDTLWIMIKGALSAIIGAYSFFFALGKHHEFTHRPKEPAELPLPLAAHFIEITIPSKIITLTYFIPQYINIDIASLPPLLKLAFQTVVLANPEADNDLLEYLVTPAFGQIVHESMTTIFRYSITQAPIIKPKEFPSHHVIIGEIID